MLAGGGLSGGSIWGHWVGALFGNVVAAPISAAIIVSMYFELRRSG